VFHVTHHKAGSQWIRRILEELADPWVVRPRADSSQFLNEPIRPRRVYPTLYVTREQFEQVDSPANSRRFIVIRDLRDTLVSAYFSLALSHRTIDPLMANYRARLKSLAKDEALIRMIREVCRPIASIQRSWLQGRDEILKYEDLLNRDEEILSRVLLDRCGLPVSRDHFARVIAANRFESRTGGRKPGAEDPRSHERKGIAGDWRNHFTDRIAKEFKGHYGDLLIASGYERDDRW
jgi:lipopolysaccharide transport system ATP-binding protein